MTGGALYARRSPFGMHIQWRARRDAKPTHFPNWSQSQVVYFPGIGVGGLVKEAEGVAVQLALGGVVIRRTISAAATKPKVPVTKQAVP